MGDASRICSYCQTLNKGAHRYCVRCSAPLDAASYGRPVARARKTRSSARRYVLAAVVVLAAAAGFMANALLKASHEVPALSEEVRADSRTASAPLLPPPVSGWTPGGPAAAAEPATAPPAASGWSSTSFPVARPNPYDVPGDPSASMVGIAPRAPRARAAVAGRRSFTNDDLLETRDAGWSTPAQSSSAPPAPVSEDVAKRESKLREKLSDVDAAQRRLSAAGPDERSDAADDLEDARRDAAKAERKLEEARRNN